MADRITRQQLDERCTNLNRRMDRLGAHVHYTCTSRYDYHAIDREVQGTDGRWHTHDVVRIGTKRELGEYLHAMMVALDDAELYARKERT